MRLSDPAERNAPLVLRDGDPGALGFYYPPQQPAAPRRQRRLGPQRRPLDRPQRAQRRRPRRASHPDQTESGETPEDETVPPGLATGAQVAHRAAVAKPGGTAGKRA